MSLGIATSGDLTPRLKPLYFSFHVQLLIKIEFGAARAIVCAQIVSLFILCTNDYSWHRNFPLLDVEHGGTGGRSGALQAPIYTTSPRGEAETEERRSQGEGK